MFAGKTTRLIERVREAEASGRRTVVVKSAVDTRYAVDHVVTHDGVRVLCVPLSRLGDLRAALGEAEYAATQVVAVDEAQFIGDLREAVVQATEADGKTLFVAGLSGDFRRDNFGQISQLLALADNVEKLSGRCTFCEQQGRRSPSHFTLRIAASTQQELVGGAEAYAPVCREHYVQLSRVREHGAPTGDTTEAEEEPAQQAAA
ncbi:hypothetical protein HXX76_002460 [Chlamydomonas incerta]|uniref:Thymidine kinase n=1 Tax=Chlamydomonas incerta TaxID=51695 RepID=A0A835TBI1_CHLIN|nr:hypothetical protein HXX76_002460 [Chlamydomonas incerta]|eukprot:KAG2442374.1 hypothetical protein HXX76_002460 [Chlamydomonas incerta]